MSDNMLICGHCAYHKECLFKANIQQKIRSSKGIFHGIKGLYIQPEAICEFYKGQDPHHWDIEDTADMQNKGE